MGGYSLKIASIPDWWKIINNFKQYQAKLNRVTFQGVGQFDDFDLVLNSGVSFLTGRNGIGKTSFLKLIHRVLSNSDDFPVAHFSSDDLKGITISLNVRGKHIDIKEESEVQLPVSVDYFDAASFSQYVLNAITINPDKSWNSGAEPRHLSGEDIEIIKKVTGKRYDSLLVEEAIPEEDEKGFTQQIPLFTVTLDDISYCNENMGSGEHKALMLIWKLLVAEKNSFLLIEEPESFICPNYQEKLINSLAWYASSKQLTVIISTHSEHVMSAQRSMSNFIFQRTGKNRFKLVPSNQESRYLSALGLKPARDKLLLVEDDFAKLKLECILAKVDQDLFDTSTVRSLKGEAHITAVACHLKKGEHVKVIGVYDADMIGKPLGGKPQLNYLFLPGHQMRAPEQAIIDFVESNVDSIALALNISADDFSAALDDHIEDHHDWFIELQRKLPTLLLSELKQKCIQGWINNNIVICKKFVFELNHLDKEFDTVLSVTDSGYILNTLCGLEYEIKNPLNNMPEVGKKFRTTIFLSENNELRLEPKYN
jgi:ABC-type cobalamin/Fe3+-siderophores transport system ATPase subunit